MTKPTVEGSMTTGGSDIHKATRSGPKGLDQERINRLLDHYEITDFDRQIRNYGQTYRDAFEDKLFAEAELEKCLKEGFYIGQDKTGLGELLSYTQIPRFIKAQWPEARVIIHDYRFTKALFRNNPYVDEVKVIPGQEPMGPFREFGFGTQTQRRLRGMGFFTIDPLGPTMVLDSDLVAKWQEWRAKLPLAGRKLVMLQSSGRTNDKVLSLFQWFSLLRSLRDEYYFVHIGNLRDQFVFPVKNMLGQYDMQNLGALLKQGDCYLGLNSGLMHLAAAVGVNSVVLHNEAKSSQFELPLWGDNLALPRQVNHHLFHVYPWHYHLVVDSCWDGPATFADRLSKETLRSNLAQACREPNPQWSDLKIGQEAEFQFVTRDTPYSAKV